VYLQLNVFSVETRWIRFVAGANAAITAFGSANSHPGLRHARIAMR
jgi:hypothetical protein